MEAVNCLDRSTTILATLLFLHSILLCIDKTKSLFLVKNDIYGIRAVICTLIDKSREQYSIPFDSFKERFTQITNFDSNIPDFVKLCVSTEGFPLSERWVRYFVYQIHIGMKHIMSAVSIAADRASIRDDLQTQWDDDNIQAK